MLWDQLRYTGPTLPTINWNFLSKLNLNFLSRLSENETNKILPHAHYTVFDSISDGALVLDQDNNVVSTNPAARKIIRSLSKNSNPTTDLLQNQHVNAVLHMWPSLKAYLNSVSREYVTSVQNGSYDVLRSFDIHITPIIDHDGIFSGRIILLHETTEREKATKALKQRKQQLQHMVERLQQVDRRKANASEGLDRELYGSLTRIDLLLNNLRKGIDEGFNDAINRLEQEISNLYERVEVALQEHRSEVHREPRAQQPKQTAQLSNVSSRTLA